MVKQIILGKRRRSCQGIVALIDNEDYELATTYPWHWDGRYARYRNKIDNKNIVIYLHRFLLNAPPDKLVDHIDGNKLDNRRHNLRLCDDLGNGRNVGKRTVNCQSKYKGVSYHRGVWRARISINRQSIELGYFQNEEDAALAYDKAAIFHHREFARLNFGMAA